MSRVGRQLNFNFVDRLLKLGGQRGVQVGFLNGETYPDRPDTTVAQVALLNEMGHGNVVPRPFIRTAFKGKANHIALIRKIGRQVVQGQRSFESALNELGETSAETLRQEIRKYAKSGTGGKTPLRDTDLMLNSIDFERV